MRMFMKEQLGELLKSMQKLHKALIASKDNEQRFHILQECQRAAIAVGESVEKNAPQDCRIVPELESYCEEVFLLSEKEIVPEESVWRLDEIIDAVHGLLEELPSTYHVVFMPYKASMWDSLESIWKACKDDVRCECFVMPIPFYQFNAENKQWEFCYEGEQFSADVPIVHYKNYSLEKAMPDIAYIHNPYDNRNFVTSVHPAFYSDKLKQHVKNLVYVPYYVTTGFVSREQLELPVYHNMDYMVTQSEYAKSNCEGMYYYDKLLPFGSPKIDKIVQTCKEGGIIPKQWQSVLQGKKVLMLNTSNSCFLQDGEVYLKKIKHICEQIKSNDKVALIWRPHPLLESTIKSMRSHLLPAYQELLKYFTDNQIGVLDRTPDITNTVALSDGYIGEEGSSVINLFGAAGKPIFILNNYMTGDFTQEEKRRIHVMDMRQLGNKLWFTTNLYNALLSMEKDTRKVRFEGRVDGQPKWYGAYPYLSEKDNEFYLSPELATGPVKYQVDTHEFEPLFSVETEMNLHCRKVVAYENKVFYLPSMNDAIIEYDRTKKSWGYYSTCIQELNNNPNHHEEVTWDCAVSGKNLWISATYTNRILQFNMEEGTHFLHTIGDDGNGYSGIVIDGGNLWLAEVNSGNIIRWNRHTGKIQNYHMPDDLCFWQQSNGKNMVHSYLLDMGDCLVTIPGFSNGMVKLSKQSGETTMLISDFWNDADKKVNGYHPKYYSSSEFGVKLERSDFLVQRRYDDAMAVVNVEDETYEMFYPTLSEEDFDRLTGGEDGFEKMEMKHGFFRRESRVFSFEGFLQDLVLGRLDAVRERQLNELSTMADNLDGTCGIRVHEYMMDVLETKV